MVHRIISKPLTMIYKSLMIWPLPYSSAPSLTTVLLAHPTLELPLPDIQKDQACFQLRGFKFSVLPTWHILFLQLFAQQSPPFRSLFKYHLLREVFPNLSCHFFIHPSVYSLNGLRFSSYHLPVSKIVIFKSFGSSLFFSLTRM